MPRGTNAKKKAGKYKAGSMGGDSKTVAERFPTLKVLIQRGPRLEVFELTDPRQAFAEAYESLDREARCYPVCSATSFAKSVRLSE
jgi:hypothetical protein